MQFLTDVEAIEAAIACFRQCRTLWLDTEVADYAAAKPRLSLIQVLADSTDLRGDRVTVLDVLDRPQLIEQFAREIVADPEIEKVFHNASYDKKFLGKSKAKNVTCTLEMVGKIPYYIIPLRDRKLSTLAETLCHFPAIDKSQQLGDWGVRPLSNEQLFYAKMDAVYVAQVHHRLLQLMQLIAPNPKTENIEALASRYRDIEHQWKQLDTEVQHLKERLKAAMEAQGISEGNGVRLSRQQRTTKKISFRDLARLTQELNLDCDFAIALNKSQQEQLGNLLEKLDVQEQVSSFSQLRFQEPSDEDFAF